MPFSSSITHSKRASVIKIVNIVKPLFVAVLYFSLLLSQFENLALAASASSCRTKLTGSSSEFSPEAKEAINFMIQADLDHCLASLPMITKNELLQIRKNRTNDGANSFATYRATYQGRPVFIKTFKHQMEMKDGLILSYLNQFGLGVKVYGFTKLLVRHPVHDYAVGAEVMVTSPVYGLVMDALGGTNVKSPNPRYKVTQDDFAEMRRQLNLVYEHGFIPVDPQFMVGAGKPVLIDTGWYVSRWMNEDRFHDSISPISEELETLRSYQIEWGEVSDH